jgi:hypothetical protein
LMRQHRSCQQAALLQELTSSDRHACSPQMKSYCMTPATKNSGHANQLRTPAA